MAQQTAGWIIGLQLEGADETYWIQPGPQDDERLRELLHRVSAMVRLADEDSDLEGHAQSADVTLDVEGHAVTIRLPSPADAAAMRRRLAVGALTATIVAAGAVAALHDAGGAAPAVDPPAAPAAPLVQSGLQNPASDVGLMDQAVQRAAEQLVMPQVQQPAVPGAEQGAPRPLVVPPVQQPKAPAIDQAAPRWTINRPYMIDKGPPAPPQVGAPAGTGAGAPAGTGAGGHSSDDRTVPRAGHKPELR